MKYLNILSMTLLLNLSPMALAWAAETGSSVQQKRELLYRLTNVIEDYGLSKTWYLSPGLERDLDQALANGKFDEAAKTITSTVESIRQDLYRGRITPNQVSSKVKIATKKLPVDKLIAKYLAGESRLEDFIQAASSKNPIYLNTLKIYQSLRAQKLNNTWIGIPTAISATKLQLGSTSEGVRYLRTKLNDFGYKNNINDPTFDAELDIVVKDFQKLNNLDSDGIVGPNSWKYLSRPLEELLTQGVLNLNKLRWLPDSFENEHVFVNLAAQNLKFYQERNLVMDFKTINGRVDRQTPLMIDHVKNVVINPTWTVPFSIMVADKLPALQKNPGYAHSMHMKVIDDLTGKEVDPYSVDWMKQSKHNLQYTLVQKPGPWNALGFIKFPMQNPYAIYLHDTDSRHLFKQANRLISSGCVRLQYPFEVGEKFLKNSKWTATSLKEASEGNTNYPDDQTWLKMPALIPVYLFHMTLFSENGKIATIPDSYGLDTAIYNLMN